MRQKWYSYPLSLLVSSHSILGDSSKSISLLLFISVVALCLHFRFKVLSMGAAVSGETTSPGLEVACWQLSELLHALL